MNTQPTSNRRPLRILLPTALALAVGLLEIVSAQAWQEQQPQGPAVGPWGISSSAGSTRNVSEWFPKMSAAGVSTVRLFPEWRDFEPTITLFCVRWYCKYQLSYRDLEEMMRERGVAVDHTTLFRWVQRYAPEINRRMRPHLKDERHLLPPRRDLREGRYGVEILV